MGETGIEYLHKVWNVCTGCTAAGAGCLNCWARELHGQRHAAYRAGKKMPLQYAVPFSHVQVLPERLSEPLHWRAPKSGGPLRVGVAFTGDPFHSDVPFGFVMRCLDVMVQAYLHDYFVLTKRPARMLEFAQRWADLSGETPEPKLVRGPEATRKVHPSGRGQLFADMLEDMGTPPPGCAYPTFDWMEGMITWPPDFAHIWLGASAWDQPSADEACKYLKDLGRMGWNTWLSLEPLLGPVDLREHIMGYQDDDVSGGRYVRLPHSTPYIIQDGPHIRLVVAGGEHCRPRSKARTCNVEWMRDLAGQCETAGVGFHLKQLGSNPRKPCPCDARERQGGVTRCPDCFDGTQPILGIHHAAGGDPAEWPEDLRGYHAWPVEDGRVEWLRAHNSLRR
jgi:protein gp37